jgi:NAD(P)-dependent dehydrogenase (short-subunit alcohol dehydrogenase family)
MLKGKVVLITGGAGTLGQEFVRTVVQNGGIAVIGEIDERKSQLLIDQLNTPNAISLYFDITSKESINQGLAKIKDKFGRLDALVNNAYPRNANYGRQFFAVEYADFCENLNINLGGYFLASQQVAAFFKTQGAGGNIVNISSIYGSMTPRFEVYDGTEMTMPVEYAAIKSALNHLTKYMARYLRGTGIRVNSLSPGGVLNRQPEKFQAAYKSLCSGKGMLESKDLTGALLFLLSDQSLYMNGQDLIVDDGFSL